MTHHYYLGVSNGECCVIDSLVPITKRNFKETIKYSKIHGTNWCGRDSVQNTCEKEGFTVKGRVILLENPYDYEYTDYDHGHKYTGIFRFDRLYRAFK